LAVSKGGMSENISTWHNCANWGWDARPASDILFIGTSRSFRSVNLTALRNSLEAKGHEINHIEMIWTDFPNTAVKAWATDEYYATDVKPKIVIVENAMSQKPRDVLERKNDANLVMMPVSQRYMPSAVHHRLQSHLNNEFKNSWTRIFDPDYMTSLEFQIHQWRVSLYDVFDAPKHVLKRRRAECPAEITTWDTNQTEDRKDYGDKTVQDEDHEQFIENVSKYIPYSPKADIRQYEVAMMSFILDRVASRDPEKTYLWFPGNYSVSYEAESESEFGALFPQVDQIIGAEVVETLRPFDRQDIFYNENHLNHAGRRHITDLWVNLLDKDLKDLSVDE
jgi:hypothetical protein